MNLGRSGWPFAVAVAVVLNFAVFAFLPVLTRQETGGGNRCRRRGTLCALWAVPRGRQGRPSRPLRPTGPNLKLKKPQPETSGAAIYCQ